MTEHRPPRQLAAPHGITSIQLGTDAAGLVVAVEKSPTYFDAAELEAETEARL